MANYISQITLPNGNTYEIKDTVARQAQAGGVRFAGLTTTALTDGATTSPIVINGSNYTPLSGNIVLYKPSESSPTQEYIWDGEAWREMGSTGSLGTLAYKSNASGSYDKTTSVTITAGANVNKKTTVTTTTGDATYTPAGTVSQPSFTGSATTSTGTFTPTGSVAVSIATSANQTVDVAPASSGTATYTPAGTVGTPTISVKTAGTTTTVKNPTAVTVAKTIATAAPGATAPSNAVTYYSVSGETLSLYQLGYTTGDSITTSNVTVKTGDAAYQSTQPSWTGTGVRLVTGNISVPATFSGSFTGTAGNVSVSGTPAGSVSQPTFTGTGVRLTTGDIQIPGSYSATPNHTSTNVTVS